MIALVLALALQEDTKELVLVDVCVVVARANLRAGKDKALKAWSPWDGVGAPTGAAPPGIDALLERLESASIEERENASKELTRMGLPALPRLKRALADASSEMKARLDGIAITLIPPPDPEPRLTILSGKDREAFRRELASRNDVSIQSFPRLTGIPHQLMPMFLGEQVAYVADMEMQVGRDAATATPIVGTAKTGQSLEIKPSLSEGRVRLDCALELAEMRGKLPSIKKIETPIGTVEDPEILRLKYRMAPVLAADELALIGPLRRPWSEKEDPRVWVILGAAPSKSK
jgi:hypothetical protein